MVLFSRDTLSLDGRALVSGFVGVSFGVSVGASVEGPVGAAVGASVGVSIGVSIGSGSLSAFGVSVLSFCALIINTHNFGRAHTILLLVGLLSRGAITSCESEALKGATSRSIDGGRGVIGGYAQK